MGAFGAFFYARYGADRVKQVASAIAESHRTVEKWFAAQPSKPSFVATLKLIHVYGLDFLRAVLVPPPEWVDPSIALRDMQAALDQVKASEARLQRFGLLPSLSSRLLVAGEPEQTGPLGLHRPDALSGGAT